MERFQITVIAYCLMPNHYHFLFRQDGHYSMSAAMQDTFNTYTKAFNTYFSRSGTLFEGPFKAKYINNEVYLVHLCRYIHRNPLDAKLADSLESWQFSNYLEWIGKRKGKLVDHDFIKGRFPNPKDYIKLVLDYTPPEKLTESIRQYIFD